VRWWPLRTCFAAKMIRSLPGKLAFDDLAFDNFPIISPDFQKCSERTSPPSKSRQLGEPAGAHYEAGSAYIMQPYIRSNARAVDRSLALKIRYSVSDGLRGHCTRVSVLRVGHISRQFHRTTSRSPKHATDTRSP